MGGDATWIHTFSDTTFWEEPSGDFSDQLRGIQVVDGVGPYAWWSAQMAADVQDWLDNPSSNFGWVLVGNEVVGATAKRFDTKETPVVANRPVLHVWYATPTPAPVPGAGPSALVALTALLAFFIVRRLAMSPKP